MPESSRQFASEPLHPVRGTSDASAMSRAEPGLPQRFVWRNAEHHVRQLLRVWKTSTSELGQLYLRRHWYEILTDTGFRMTIYCTRQAPGRKRGRNRWWVYTVSR